MGYFEGPSAAPLQQEFPVQEVLLLLGLAGGYRVGELASLRGEDVEMVDEGAIVLLRKSRTDGAGEGFYKGIPHGDHQEACPVSHLATWMELLLASSGDGPVFRGVDRHGNIGGRPMVPDSVPRIVKKRAHKAGLGPSRYSGHSLRAGFVTAASEGGAHDKDIMRQTAHRSLATLHRYRRTMGLFKNNPASLLGLGQGRLAYVYVVSSVCPQWQLPRHWAR